ncbi:MAG: rod shape-determining protein RodA, partial [Alphaproteobacteria bacterium]|nr:rod shape-determining protein RodA [Alphaproteobacteria bacterium]
AGALLLSLVSVDRWKQVALPGFLIIVVMLFGVELLGAVSKGSRRWLDLGFIRLQPSEILKLFIVLAVARFYDLLPAGEIRGGSAIWPALLMAGIPALMIMAQPDLGTALMVVAGAVSVMFMAGVPLRLFLGGGAALTLLAPVAFHFMHDYQRKRVLIFLNPESDPLGAGYHITQSKIAIGSGGIFGKGFMNGSQSHLDYLPEGHTDFVFATMAEEWGLIGGMAIIFAYLYIIRWGFKIAGQSRGRFARLTAAGLSTTLFFYMSINIMMVLGMAPVVGIPLPLISFGGTAMMTVMAILGILMALERDCKGSGGLHR